VTSVAVFVDIIIAWWLYCALAMSFFWGFRGVFFFGLDTLEGCGPSAFRKRHPRWERFFQGSYQFVFNGVGSFAGWLCLYALAVHVRPRLPGLTGFGWGDVLLFVFALVGLTGHLPQAVVGFLRIFEKIGEKVASKLT
jgi:hypothetical protein